MLKKFLKDKTAATTVEFSLTIGIFLFIVLLFFELARIALISAYLDLAVAESARLARIDAYGYYDNNPERPFDYKDAFEKRLKEGKLWSTLHFGNSTDKIITIDVKYADSPDDLIHDIFRGKERAFDSKEAQLAEYSVRYEYKKWIPIVPDVLTKPIFIRKFVIVQEYEKKDKH
ncbi:hypothetical protein BMT54_07650 [Pasteurellaceae bacterium 15-036681]|nr:hypothetical protein BMT54_07650 [Pasteurellaceae bacterium 15-036681]